MRLFDTHSHLNDEAFSGDLAEIVERAEQAGVEAVVVPGYDLPSSERALELAHRFDILYAAVGIHPHDASSADEAAMEKLRLLAKEDRVVAIGEIGLDYHYDHSPRDVQREVFERHIALARELNLPVIVHDREAHADTLEILKRAGASEVGGVMHCFSGSLAMAQECLHLGFYLSFGGPVTFKNARRPKEVAAQVPEERLLIETDAPYLTPEPHRGKRNEPAYVALVAEALAKIRETEPEQLALATRANARRLFRVQG
ncbi:MAG: TatD family hydrolase [Kyrpidia tusciae]|nr:TatD family hydrolase [Kyrpidia tusciae]MBE3552173.1 TatD family hydrolase [Kyrpidia tusciae]